MTFNVKLLITKLYCCRYMGRRNYRDMDLTLGENLIRWKLREVMARKKVTNRDLAQAIGIHEGSVSRLKSADEMPRIDGKTLEQLCQVLNCELSDLIERESVKAGGAA